MKEMHAIGFCPFQKVTVFDRAVRPITRPHLSWSMKRGGHIGVFRVSESRIDVICEQVGQDRKMQFRELFGTGP
jgi:hypothetical protein